MNVVVPSCGKVNLTLRVVGRRRDGYHSLVSVFCRLPRIESMSIGILPPGNVDQEVTHAIRIQGRNIVWKVLELLRARGVPVPPLKIVLAKTVPPGTGLGAGSGNGAALFRWARSWYDCPVCQKDLTEVGADLPFLAGDHDLALISGIGEDVCPMPPLVFSCLLLVPRWRSKTLRAYGLLDKYHGSRWPLSQDEAEAEAHSIVERLGKSEPVGLLPNDFLPPLSQIHDGYHELFAGLEASGALAWGLSGSGSAVFGLYPQGRFSREQLLPLHGLNGVERLLVME